MGTPARGLRRRDVLAAACALGAPSLLRAANAIRVGQSRIASGPLAAVAWVNSTTRPMTASIAAAMEGMRDVDLGGYRVRHARDYHHGSHFVEITMVDARGEYVR